MEIDEKPDLSPKNIPSTGDIREDQYKIGDKHPPLQTRFTPSNQPTKEGVEKRLHTKKVKKAGRELIKEMLTMKISLNDFPDVKKQLIQMYGERVLKLTVIEIMTLRQFQKAILKADTQAYKNIMDQSHGLLKQIMEHSGVDGKPMEMVTTAKRVIIQNPHAISTNKQ